MDSAQEPKGYLVDVSHLHRILSDDIDGLARATARSFIVADARHQEVVNRLEVLEDKQRLGGNA